MATTQASEHAIEAGMPRRLVVLFALACGVTVANNYYAQPLLDLFSRDLGISTQGAGLVFTLGQLGYLAGLLLIVPLGDVRDRRRLVPGSLAVATLGLVAMAAAPGAATLWAAAVLVGVSTTVAQVLVPLASLLALPDQRGRIIGAVMSGLMFGQLLARTAAGSIAELFGWRAVYVVAAVATATLAVVLPRALPAIPPTRERLRYRALLASVGAILRGNRPLQLACAYTALMMACFSAMWTAIAFLLARPPYDYSEATIGLFGLAGIAGVLAAQAAGRIADRGVQRPMTGALLATGVGAFALLGVGETMLLAVLAGVVLVDLAAQGLHVTQQTIIYQVPTELRSRVNTAYMSCRFFGATVGSAAGAAAFAAGGWGAVCWLGGALSATALLLWLARLDRR